MKKETNNKGFSLVELIVVIAIMAVLVGVLAPSLLRYVEKARLQRDNSAISEVCEAAIIACAQENVNSEVAAGTKSYSTEGKNSFTFACTTSLGNELYNTIGSTLELESNTYNKKDVTITVEVNNTVPTVYVDGWINEVGGTATKKEFTN